MASLPQISLSPGVASSHHNASHNVAIPPMNLPTLAHTPARNPQMSVMPLLGDDDDDDSSVSSSDSGSTSGSEMSFEHLSAQVSHSVSSPIPPGSKGAGSKFDFSVGTPTSAATTRRSSFSSSESDARNLSAPLKAVHSGVTTSGDKSPIMYDSNGRRKSNAGLAPEQHSPHAAGPTRHQHHQHHRQIEADLLNRRHLVVLSSENATNIARIHIEVDSKAASAMAARTFVDTDSIQVHQQAHPLAHQRRASYDHLAPLPAARRSSLTNPQAAVPQSLSPLYMNAAHISAFKPSAAGGAEGRVPAHAMGQLTHAGRVIANSTRLMKSGVSEHTVGRVECLTDMHNSSFNQPRFAQQTVGSLMSIKHVQ